MRLHAIMPAILFSALLVCMAGCADEDEDAPWVMTVPHQGKWGIYSLTLATQETRLIYSTSGNLSVLQLNNPTGMFAFAEQIGGEGNDFEEICTLDEDGSGFMRLTSNAILDVYPAWSPDGSRIAFLSFPGADLDIYVMDSDGTGATMLFDSGSHDADIHWCGDRIAFTTGSRIWTMKDDGTGATQLTDPPNAGVWGNANLPFGDYDPRFSPDGGKVAFERLEDDTSVHGNYNIYVIDSDATNETRLTDTWYSMGFPNWSNSGDRIVYVVAAINDAGCYDIWMMDSDGTNDASITPAYFPPDFLCHCAVFSSDDTMLYFIGQWYND